MSIIRQGFESADLDVPVVLPTLNLDFANSQSLDKRITFSRGSIGTRVNRNGLIETIAANQPRFDFDPISGECKGLLIEEPRTNSLLRSEDFTTTWGASAVSVSSNVITAPDGNTTADKLVENTSFSSFKFVVQGVGSLSGTYTLSAFFKAGERYSGYLQLFGAGGNATTGFNLRTGTISGGAGTNTITPYGNGWYRISTSATFSGSAAIYIVLYNDSGITNYTGDGTSGIYLWGAQLEAGAFPTSYIPTTASIVPRSADNAQMTGTNFSSWYNQTESTIFCEFNAYQLMSTVQRNVFNILGSEILGLNRVQLQLNGVGGGGTTQPIYHNLYQNGPNFADYFGLSYTTGPTKNIMRYKDLDTFVASKDGNIRKNTQARLQTIPLTKNMNSLTFGTFNGAISKFAYYPKALNDAEIQYLTQ
jgi:hypothetical protein